MAVLRLKVGDRIVSCYSWSDLDPRLNDPMAKKYHMHPGSMSRNGRTGTIVKVIRNSFGRIENVVIEWDMIEADRTRWTMHYDPTFNPRLDTWPLSLAIRYLHPIEHCNTCKHRVARLAEGSCLERKYEMNNKAFVSKWRRRLMEKKSEEA